MQSYWLLKRLVYGLNMFRGKAVGFRTAYLVRNMYEVNVTVYRKISTVVSFSDSDYDSSFYYLARRVK
jgi:hypothetical protein